MLQLTEIFPFYHEWLSSLNTKKVDYLSCIEGKGDKKDLTWITQYHAVIVSLV